MNPERDLTDTELIGASVRDPAAFELLFERHAPAMRGWLASQLRDVALANDLVAETFAQAWRSRRRFAGDGPDAGASWLYGIARNLLRQHYKRGRVENRARRRLGMNTTTPREDDLDEIIDRLDAESEQARLDLALATLPDAQRRAIDGRVVRGLDYREVAAELECSTQNARAHVSRGLRALNAILKGEHP